MNSPHSSSVELSSSKGYTVMRMISRFRRHTPTPFCSHWERNIHSQYEPRMLKKDTFEEHDRSMIWKGGTLAHPVPPPSYPYLAGGYNVFHMLTIHDCHGNQHECRCVKRCHHRSSGSALSIARETGRNAQLAVRRVNRGP